MKDKGVVSKEKVKQLHQSVVDVIHKVKVIIKNHKISGERELTLGEKVGDAKATPAMSLGDVLKLDKTRAVRLA